MAARFLCQPQAAALTPASPLNEDGPDLAGGMGWRPGPALWGRARPPYQLPTVLSPADFRTPRPRGIFGRARRPTRLRASMERLARSATSYLRTRCRGRQMGQRVRRSLQHRLLQAPFAGRAQKSVPASFCHSQITSSCLPLLPGGAQPGLPGALGPRNCCARVRALVATAVVGIVLTEPTADVL